MSKKKLRYSSTRQNKVSSTEIYRKFRVTNAGTPSIIHSCSRAWHAVLFWCVKSACPMSACNKTTLTAVSEAHVAAFVLLGVIGLLVIFALVMLVFVFGCVGTQACKQHAARASEQRTLSIPTAERATEEGASEQTTLSIPPYNITL